MRYLLIFVFAFLINCSVSAVDGALFKFNLYQSDSVSGKDILLYSDSTEVEKDKTMSGFIGPLSIEIELQDVDSQKVYFLTHLITLGPVTSNFAESYTVEYGLPARIDNIKAKNDLRYRVDIIPVHKAEIDSSRCSYNHRSKNDFTYQPSAHFDIYFVQNTLGDYFYDSIKELLEKNFRQYKAAFNLTMPGKTSIYVPPCPVKSVLWDMRYGIAVDPTRNSAYAVYNKDINTVDPFLANHTVLLRTYGYSAPILSEGMANYFSFAYYDMKKMLKENKEISVGPLLDSYTYYTTNARLADRVSATFVRYLIDAYQFEKFMVLYKKADDLNLKETIEQTYEKNINQLETEWKTYIDTLTIAPEIFGYYAADAEMMLNYQLAYEYNLERLNISSTRDDSLRAMTNLKRSAYFVGNYYQASDLIRELLTVKKEDAALWMELGAYDMMNGLYDSAYAHFTKAEKLDEKNEVIQFNLAMYAMVHKNYDKAKDILMNNFTSAKGATAQIETRVLLGDILKESGRKENLEQAEKYYTEAIRMYRSILQANNSNSAVYMWMGIAYLGLDDYTNAINNLHIAEFLESRPFYQGMIALWLGKAFMAVDDKENAKHYLAQVLSFASADYHQNEAKELLKKLN